MTREFIICTLQMLAIMLCPFVCLADKVKGHPRIQPVCGDLMTVDIERLDDALDACDFILKSLTPEGRYEVDTRWGSEGAFYYCCDSSVLIEAYRITGKVKYLEGAQKILDLFKHEQLSSGGWALQLTGGGQEFVITEKQHRDSWQQEALPTIGIIAYVVGKYHNVSGDACYDAMVNRAIDHLLKYWDPEKGYFVEDAQKEFTGLRSAPATYQMQFLLGFQVWQQWRPELRPIVQRLTEALRKDFELFDDSTMPFVRAMFAVLLMKNSSQEYITEKIKPRLDQMINSRIFRCPEIVGGYGHRDWIRGIVADEANCRGSGSMALAMKIYDLTTNTRTYRDSKEYREVAAWIDGMKDRHGYFEYQQQHGMKRLGKGSPGQFIPCWWIFGAL